MRLLETIRVPHSEPKFIRLYQGDLTALPSGEEVDVLVVSAFPNDYTPTPRSLVGALHRKGVSVAQLSINKEVDLRNGFSCWLSRDLSGEHPDVGFRRILCFEPLARGRPAEVVGDVFRSIIPFAYGDPPVRGIAMPVLASGDQAENSAEMLRAMLEASIQWLGHGLPINNIKIVVYSIDESERLRSVFSEVRFRLHADELTGTSSPMSHGYRAAPGQDSTPRADYDYFISYSHQDSTEVEALVRSLHEARPSLRIFFDKLELKPGCAWQTEIDKALAGCRKVVSVYSPAYLSSKVCMEEFNMARVRHRKTADVLLPIYLRSADLLLYMESIQYVDCREAAMDRIQSACHDLLNAVA